MKNIYVLPTDKPSRLISSGKEFNILNTPVVDKRCKNIYITSDEEIKEGGWHYNLALNVVEKTTKFNNGLLQEKIILTTAAQLIKDGVQAIDDEFLEWLCNNPSCEYVKTELIAVNEYDSEITTTGYGFDKFIYKIIIPKEDPKQETLEEAAKREIPELNHIINSLSDARRLWIKGAKWQAERMYSEEEVLKSFDSLGFKKITSEELNSLSYEPFITDEDGNIWVIDKEKWFEQSKKKV